ncbi:MAG: hypothetical protein HRT57_07560 [Crocinitomicaceae bacterium]|nr:hypothetical protein [Crocinitomicaceae bacterium]
MESLRGSWCKPGVQREYEMMGFLGKTMFDPSEMLMNIPNVKQPAGSRMCGACTLINAIVCLHLELDAKSIQQEFAGCLKEFNLPAQKGWTDVDLKAAMETILTDIIKGLS